MLSNDSPAPVFCEEVFGDKFHLNKAYFFISCIAALVTVRCEGT